MSDLSQSFSLTCCYIQQDYVSYIKDNPHTLHQYIRKCFLDNIMFQFIRRKIGVHMSHYISRRLWQHVVSDYRTPTNQSIHVVSRRFWQHDVSLEYNIQIRVYVWILWLIVDIVLTKMQSWNVCTGTCLDQRIWTMTIHQKKICIDRDKCLWMYVVGIELICYYRNKIILNVIYRDTCCDHNCKVHESNIGMKTK